jgi:uncharacterized membrane protein
VVGADFVSVSVNLGRSRWWITRRHVVGRARHLPRPIPCPRAGAAVPRYVPAVTAVVDAIVQFLLVVAGAVLLAILWIVGADAGVVLVVVLGWDCLAAVHLLRRFTLMWAGRFEDRAADRMPSTRTMRLRFAATLVASASGLSSGILVVDVDIIAGTFDSEVGVLTALKICAAATVVLAWSLLHAGYATHYANLYLRHGRGMSFPGAQTPNDLDFGYFAYTVGTTFATSDVEIRSRPVRHAVLWHSVLSFFYNAAVLGIAISAFTGK